MFEGPRFESTAPNQPEKTPPTLNEYPKAEVREIQESPSRTALLEAIAAINKSKFKVIDTYTEKGTFGAPYAPAPEGRELIKKRFRNEDEAREYAEPMNRTKGDPRPDVTQFQVRPIENPLEDLI